MTKLAYSAAIAALVSSASAIKQKSSIAPDVYGPNGENYQHNTADYDMSRIGIDIVEKGSGDKCRPGDWVQVHWVGTLKDGRVVTDSRAEPGGRPKEFSLGHREVFHCWDLALTQLHVGDKAHLDCPSYYAYGGAFTWAPIGGEPIPLHSDIEFDIEVLQCDRVPDRLPDTDVQPVTSTMQPNRCMYIHSEAAEEEFTPLVITCENEDRIHAPGFNLFPVVPCYLDEWVKESKHQEFYYYEDTKSIKDAAHGWEVCIQFGMLGLCDFSQVDSHTNPAYDRTPTQWWYDGVTQTLQSKRDWGSLFPMVYHTRKDEQIYISSHTNQDLEPLQDINAHFRIEYCWKNF